MFNPESNLAALLAAPMRPGRLVWIGLRPARREAVESVDAALAKAGKGLAGDHYNTLRDGKRQVTLMQHEHLAVIASYIGQDSLAPEVLRRNLVTRGINLLALKGKHFRIGNVVLEYTGECHPCSRVEESLGLGGTTRCVATVVSRRALLKAAPFLLAMMCWLYPKSLDDHFGNVCFTQFIPARSISDIRSSNVRTQQFRRTFSRF